MTIIVIDIIFIENQIGGTMVINAISLSDWLKKEYKDYPSMSPVEQKEEAAETLNIGLATLYRWLKAGSVYIQQVSTTDCGDDSRLVVWKMEKSVFE